MPYLEIQSSLIPNSKIIYPTYFQAPWVFFFNIKLLKGIHSDVWYWVGMGLASGSVVNKSLAIQETHEMQVPSLGREDPLEEGMATHSSILAWRIPWTEEPGGLKFLEWQIVGHNWACMYTHVHCLLYIYANFWKRYSIPLVCLSSIRILAIDVIM